MTCKFCKRKIATEDEIFTDGAVFDGLVYMDRTSPFVCQRTECVTKFLELYDREIEVCLRQGFEEGED